MPWISILDPEYGRKNLLIHKEDIREFILRRNLYIMNEESENTTFQSRRGARNVDITLLNNKLITTISEWKKEESCSVHNIMKYSVSEKTIYRYVYNYLKK